MKWCCALKVPLYFAFSFMIDNITYLSNMNASTKQNWVIIGTFVDDKVLF